MKSKKTTQHLPSPTWRSADEITVNEDEVWNYIISRLSKKEENYKITVGTDSHMHRQEIKFITAVCIHNVGKGGNYFFLESQEFRDDYVSQIRGKKVKGNHKLRMFNEVVKSVEVATNLHEHTGVVPVIHIDASPSQAAEFTSEFSDTLRGYVISNGFECVLKPEAFTANAIADKHSK